MGMMDGSSLNPFWWAGRRRLRILAGLVVIAVSLCQSHGNRELVAAHTCTLGGDDCPYNEHCYRTTGERTAAGGPANKDGSGSVTTQCDCDQSYGLSGEDCTTISAVSIFSAIAFSILAAAWCGLGSSTLFLLLSFRKVSNRLKKISTAVYKTGILLLFVSTCSIFLNIATASMSLGAGSVVWSYLMYLISTLKVVSFYIVIEEVVATWYELIAALRCVEEKRGDRLAKIRKAIRIVIPVLGMSYLVVKVFQRRATTGLLIAMALVIGAAASHLYIAFANLLKGEQQEEQIYTGQKKGNFFPPYYFKFSSKRSDKSDNTSIGTANTEDTQQKSVSGSSTQHILHFSEAVATDFLGSRLYPNALSIIGFYAGGIRKTIEVTVAVSLVALCCLMVTKEVILYPTYGNAGLFLLSQIVVELAGVVLAVIVYAQLCSISRYCVVQLLRGGHIVGKLKKHRAILPSFHNVGPASDELSPSST